MLGGIAEDCWHQAAGYLFQLVLIACSKGYFGGSHVWPGSFWSVYNSRQVHFSPVMTAYGEVTMDSRRGEGELACWAMTVWLGYKITNYERL